MNLDLRPKARVADLLVQLTNLSKRHNWSEAFAGTEGAKNKIRFLIGALQPPSLRTHMLGRVRFAKTTLQDDVDGFLHELSDCIEGFERDLLREQTRRPFKRPSTSSQSSSALGADAKKRKFTGTCLKCRQLGHHNKDCPAKPSPEEQKRLIAQFRLEKENKFAKPSHYIKLATISNFHLNESRFVKVILANGKLICKGVLDSGADATIISGRIVDQLKNLCVKLYFRFP